MITVRSSPHYPTPVLGNGSVCSPQRSLSSRGDADALVQKGSYEPRRYGTAQIRDVVPYVPQPHRPSAGPGADAAAQVLDVKPLPQQPDKVHPGQTGDVQICIKCIGHDTLGSANGEVKIGRVAGRGECFRGRVVESGVDAASPVKTRCERFRHGCGQAAAEKLRHSRHRPLASTPGCGPMAAGSAHRK
ncbi:hypothetical protein Bbelb_411840 [Branchiostoma belcheri]|nr:hypothetical protein Bbelb_411840 [Branchiostoma belcheri]